MPWDDEAARAAVEEFARNYSKIEALNPEAKQALNLLRESWRAAYMECGHKRLGRIMLGQSVESACRERGG